MGMSMGGFGALLYARRRAERRQPVQALALLAPALITAWDEMSKRDAFHSAADWASMDPLRHLGAIQGVPTAVSCGTEDPFISGVRKFIADTHPVLAYTARGRHGDSFNRTEAICALRRGLLLQDASRLSAPSSMPSRGSFQPKDRKLRSSILRKKAQ